MSITVAFFSFDDVRRRGEDDDLVQKVNLFTMRATLRDLHFSMRVIDNSPSHISCDFINFLHNLSMCVSHATTFHTLVEALICPLSHHKVLVVTVTYFQSAFRPRTTSHYSRIEKIYYHTISSFSSSFLLPFSEISREDPLSLLIVL